MRGNIREPAVYYMPLRAFLPSHYVDNLLWLLNLVFNVGEMFLEVKVLVNYYAKVFVGVNYGYERLLVHLSLDT